MPEQLPLKPIESDLAATLQATIDQRPALEKVVGEAVTEGLRGVAFIGAGGSMIAAHPAHYLLQRESTIPVEIYQSDVFNTSAPKRVGPGTLVFLASYTGTTKETVLAARAARAAGATVVAVTKEGTPLAEEATVAFAGKSDVFYLLAAYALLKETGVERDWVAVKAMLAALPAALVTAAEEHEPNAHEIAEAFKDAETTFVLGSGPSAAWAYGLAMCYLQEMQWKHAYGYDSGEFFQGSFEMVDDVVVINILGEDPTRPMAERAKQFLGTHAADRTKHIDVAALSLPGIPPQLRGDVSPLVIGELVGRVARHYEALRGHDMDQRRYMFQMDY